MSYPTVDVSMSQGVIFRIHFVTSKVNGEVRNSRRKWSVPSRFGKRITAALGAVWTRAGIAKGTPRKGERVYFLADRAIRRDGLRL